MKRLVIVWIAALAATVAFARGPGGGSRPNGGQRQQRSAPSQRSGGQRQQRSAPSQRSGGQRQQRSAPSQKRSPSQGGMQRQQRSPSGGHGVKSAPSAPRRHHESKWGRGGGNFLPELMGGLAADVAARAVNEPTSVVVEDQPPAVAEPVALPPPRHHRPPRPEPRPGEPPPPSVYQQRTVWIDGRFVDQVQPDGTIRRVWQQGHYETRAVQVQ